MIVDENSIKNELLNIISNKNLKSLEISLNSDKIDHPQRLSYLKQILVESLLVGQL